MAFNPAPSAWIAEYSLADGVISIPIASLPGLEAGPANPTTGDIREVLYRLLATLDAAWQAAGANIPVEWQENSGQALNPSNGTITQTYQHTFNLTPGSVDVTAEP
jgi:hypothetical protein